MTPSGLPNWPTWVDVFEKLSHLNLSLQGPENTIIDCSSAIAAFDKKLELWWKMADNMTFTAIITFNKCTSELVKSGMKPIILNHLNNIRQRLKFYFGETLKRTDQLIWLVSPFTVTTEEVISTLLPLHLADQLIEVSADIRVKSLFPSISLPEFWSAALPKYSDLAEFALKQLLPLHRHGHARPALVR